MTQVLDFVAIWTLTLGLAVFFYSNSHFDIGVERNYSPAAV